LLSFTHLPLKLLFNCVDCCDKDEGEHTGDGGVGTLAPSNDEAEDCGGGWYKLVCCCQHQVGVGVGDGGWEATSDVDDRCGTGVVAARIIDDADDDENNNGVDDEAADGIERIGEEV
jgi:hypothetical protein